MARYSVNWSAPLSSTSGDVAIGDALVSDSSGRHYVATSANRTTYGRCVGISTMAGSSGSTVEVVAVGIVDSSTTGLGAGTVSWVRVDADGRLERCTPGVGDDIVGKVHADGTLQLSPGAWDSANAQPVAQGGAVVTPAADTNVTLSASQQAFAWVEVVDGAWMTGPFGVIWSTPASKDVGRFVVLFNNSAQTVTVDCGGVSTKTLTTGLAQQFWLDDGGVFNAGGTFTP